LHPTIRETLPPVYGRLLGSFFDRPAIEEPRATCNDCRMCDKGDRPPELAPLLFLEETKCCTWMPYLPNYLVGAILADDTSELAEGRARIRERIAARVAIFPSFVAPSKKYSLLYHAATNLAFGRTSLLKCAYLTNDRACSIWRHREAVCMTWFCTYGAGTVGRAFWSALKEYLTHVERTLATWATRQISPSVDPSEPERSRPEALSLADIEERADERVHAKLWADWVGREEAFYVAAHERVRRLTREEFQELVDDAPAGRALLAPLAEAYRALHTKRVLPPRLALHPNVRVTPIAHGVAISPPQSPAELFEVEGVFFDALTRFSHDKSVTDTRRELREHECIEIDDDVLTHFVTHGILVPGPRAGVCALGPVEGEAWTRTSSLDAKDANLVFSRYARHFARKDRATRDVNLLRELIADLRLVAQRLSDLSSGDARPDLDRDRTVVREKIELYEQELSSIERVQSSLPPREAAKLMGALALDQDALHKLHVAGRPPRLRRPALLARMIEALTRIRTRLGKLPPSPHTMNDLELMNARLASWQAELDEIHALRRTLSDDEVFDGIAQAAHRLADLHAHLAAQDKPAPADHARLGEVCDELDDLGRALRELHRDDDRARASIDALTERLLSLENVFEMSSRRPLRRA
jgi:hypothetical protein